MKLLKAVEKVKPDLDAIQPEKTLTGAVKGVTVEQAVSYTHLDVYKRQVWSCKRSLSGGLERAARTGYNNSEK